METTIRAMKTRTVSSRELSRRTAELLNEIDDEGHGIVIVRFGRAAALLVPLERRPSGVRKVAIEEREEEPFVLPELDESQIRLLGEISRSRPDAYRPSDWIGDISWAPVAHSRRRAGGG